MHRAYSEPLAVLTGDSLIVLAFDVLASVPNADCARAMTLVRILAPDGNAQRHLRRSGVGE